MRIAVIQMEIAAGSPEVNRKTVKEGLQSVQQRRPDVVVLPEMWNIGYALDRAEELADRGGREVEELVGPLAGELGATVVAGSVANKKDGGIYNTLHVFSADGRRIAEYDKAHLFRLMEEEKYLTPGEQLCTFRHDGCICGAAICYDLRFPELFRSLALLGSEIVFVPAVWPSQRVEAWRRLLIARAIEDQMFVVGCNRVGYEGETWFSGHSMVVDPLGTVIGECADEIPETLVVDIDPEQVREVRETIPVFRDRRPELYRLG
ncbi:MAG: carbon-nitrogen family hydrolase [Synergistales bacterium]|nr:carbon-nitrogen family hydrolase [Synergistales bacterium]